MAASIKIFSMEGKGLKLDTAEALEPHIADLKVMDSVAEIRILGNTLGVGACKRLGEILSTKKSLQVANLADIFTGRLLNEIPEGLSFLLTSILNLPNLHTINLNDNAFGLNTQAPLVAFLAAHVPLQHLHLNNNGLGPHAGILIADALSELHAKKEVARNEGKQVAHLETVICGRNRLENGSMTAWAKAFSLHSNIKEVKMVQNGIRQEGISHLINEGLSHAAGLVTLDLQDNTFTLMGAKALAKVAPTWTSIRELGVGDSLLGAKGAVLLGEALGLGKNKNLEILRLQYNDITAKGLSRLAKAAAEALPALRKIELNGNKIREDNEAITALQELLEDRKKRLGVNIKVEDEWGLDSLSDLESEDSDEEEDDDEDEEEQGNKPEKRAKELIQEAKEVQKEPVIQKMDAKVDNLAAQLEKAII